MPTKPTRPRSQTIGLLACWLVGSSYRRLVGSSARWPNKASSSMNAGRRMRISSPSMERMEYNADEADEIAELNNRLFGLLARRLILSLACWLVGLLAEQSTLLNECWEEDEDPSPQHGMNGVQC
jgi:hypothetical protein